LLDHIDGLDGLEKLADSSPNAACCNSPRRRWSNTPSNGYNDSAMSDVTTILSAIDSGDPRAAEELLPLVYDELRRLARQKMAQECPGQTLDATGLVHEAYVRLVKAQQSWNSRGHFFMAAAEAMRRILIEQARRKGRLRHGGGRARIDLDQLDVADATVAEALLELDQALQHLAEEEPAVVQVVQLRYFAGLTIDQTAEALAISVRTANRHWAYAKAWLYQQLNQ
jgi:RNA polymerase sigma factor (TIGR02999 family)